MARIPGWLAAAMVAVAVDAGCKRSDRAERVHDEPTAPPRTLVYRVDAGDPEHARQTIGARIRALGLSAEIAGDASYIEVRLDGRASARIDEIKAVLAVDGTLAFFVVDDAHAPKDAFDAATLPARVSVKTEIASRRQLPYLRIAPLDGEARPATIARAGAMLQAIAAPAGDRWLLGTEGAPEKHAAESTAFRSYLARSPAALEGHVADAKLTPVLGDGRPGIEVTFDDAGRAAFAQLTAEHVDERIAIALDELVVAAPVVHGPIAGGKAVITLGAQDGVATPLLVALRTPSLGAKLTFVLDGPSK